ncbi:MAG TPA: hypothetical protein VNA12_08220 [Mycobacteriales bacterium]|nr:hypothetical protein [Mycobacteriales bacterium]
MRTPTLTTLPTPPLESALGTARDVALTARDKGLELLDSDAAQELLRRGQHIAIVARDRGTELLESDAAHELRRRSRDVVAAAKGDLIPTPTRSRKGIGAMLFVAGAAAGVVAAIVSKRMATPLPEALAPTYDDPAAQFPQKGGMIDLTSVAADEGVTDTPVEDMTTMGDAEIGTSTNPPLATTGTGSGSGSSTSNGRARRSSAKPAAEGPTA